MPLSLTDDLQTRNFSCFFKFMVEHVFATIKRSFLVLVLVLLQLVFPLAFSYGQYSQYRFEYLTTRNGLSQNHVNCIFQDKEGFIWIGTYNGLNRFDGYNIKTFHSGDSHSSLSSDPVNAIFQDSNGFIWVGTDLGLNKMDPVTNKIEQYFNLNPDSSLHVENNVRTIFEDDKGLLWIGFYGGGIKVFDPQKGGFIDSDVFFESELLPGHAKVNAFYEDKLGVYWIGTENMGLVEFHPETGVRRTHHIYSEKEGRSEAIITTITPDNEGKLWIGTWSEGVKVLDPQKGVFRDFNPSGNHNFPDVPVTSVFADDGIIWIGTMGNGVYRYDRNSGESVNINRSSVNIHGLNNDIVWEVFQDRSGVIWLGTYGGGVNLFYPGSGVFNVFRAAPDHKGRLNNSYVSAFYELSHKSLLIGTLGGGVNILDVESGRFSYLLEGEKPLAKTIRYIFRDKDDRVWISTSSGLYRYDKNLEERLFFPFDPSPNGIGDKSIYSIFQDSRGHFWFGQWGDGLKKLEYSESFKNDPREMAFKGYRNADFVGNTVWDFIEDRKGNVWIGAGNGLFRYQRDKDKFVNYPFPGSSGAATISCFYEDEINSRLVMGTLGRGVAILDLINGGISFLNVKDGLLSNDVLSLHSDQERNLWICTSNGLSRFDPRSGQFRHLNVEMGMQENELLNHSWSLSENRILVAGNNGFYLFYPDELVDSPFEPNVVITDFRVNGEESKSSLSTAETEEYDWVTNLQANENTVSIEFAALDYRMSDKIDYRYKLDGFDQDWNVVHAGNRRATYTNLDGGNYVFRVKASNSDGLWTGQEKSIVLNLKPPFYRHPLFRGAGVLLLAMVILILFRIRERKLKSAHKRERIMTNLRHMEEEIEDARIRREELEKGLQEKEKEFAAVKVLLYDRENRLRTLRDHLSGIVEKACPEVKRKMQNILGQFDREVSKDVGIDEFLQRLDTVQDGFISKLAEAFPKLTQKDLLICAYIRMGKSNKEIAEHMAISTQSVEMSRYRIRKKTDIDASITLNDFLVRF